MTTKQTTNMSMLLALLTLVSWNAPLGAQTETSPVSSNSRIVGFRSVEWKTVHANPGDDGQATIQTLEKLGCQVQKVDFTDHIGIKFTCPDWRSMKLETDSLVTQWVNWCNAQGLETVVINPNVETNKPRVKFRLVSPRTVHLHNSENAEKIVNTLNLVGTEISTQEHQNHLDLTFSAPEWITIELQSTENAKSWQTWLSQSGFETNEATP